ncbi:MAG TPA: four helix bundle protein [Planctomycetaceae bacterium]|nr:four helix bundle protein [Planctomycetaceae bacterium]
MQETRFRFERLEVWQKAVVYARSVYAATKSFPTSERYGLISQLRRASVSISSNIAEGSSRSSDTDFARFLEIAYGSLMECVSQMYIARQEGLLADKTFETLYLASDELGRMLSRFRATLKSS